MLDDNFLADEVLDPAAWQVAAGDANGVRLVGSDAAFWLSWTTPDVGFGLEFTSNPTDPNSWAATGWTATLMGPVKRILVHSMSPNPDPAKTYEPDPSGGFFRLFKP